MKRTFTILGLIACVISFSSCVYQDTMNERNAEGIILQNELNIELEKGKKLIK